MSRIFISINFNETHRQWIKKTAEQSRTFVDRGKYVSPDLYHLTVQFLGEMEPESADDIGNVINQCVDRFLPFELEFDRMGYFERRNKAILWIGIFENQVLFELREEINQRMKKLGFIDEKPFRPHITIARQVVFKDEHSKENLIKRGIDIPPFRVDQIDLMESLRLDSQLTYRSMKAYKLAGKKGSYS